MPDFCADLYPVPNLKVSCYPGLSGHDHMVPDPGTAGNTDLGDKQAVLAHHDVVGNHDQVVDLGAALYPGPAESRPVHRGIGADLDVVVNLHYAGLGDFYMPAGSSWAYP